MRARGIESIVAQHGRHAPAAHPLPHRPCAATQSNACLDAAAARPPLHAARPTPPCAARPKPYGVHAARPRTLAPVSPAHLATGTVDAAARPSASRAPPPCPIAQRPMTLSPSAARPSTWPGAPQDAPLHAAWHANRMGERAIPLRSGARALGPPVPLEPAAGLEAVRPAGPPPRRAPPGGPLAVGGGRAVAGSASGRLSPVRARAMTEALLPPGSPAPELRRVTPCVGIARGRCCAGFGSWLRFRVRHAESCEACSHADKHGLSLRWGLVDKMPSAQQTQPLGD